MILSISICKHFLNILQNNIRASDQLYHTCSIMSNIYLQTLKKMIAFNA